MCGIAGIMNLVESDPVPESLMRQMLGMIRHRGPDEFGIYLDPHVGLGSARLSILDLEGGQQPICNERGNLWIVFNGEIFNHDELRVDLENRGHRFKTRTDTEVVLHLYEEYGPECLLQLNGQWALAIWDTCERRLFLARDRLGVRPLFYTTDARRLVFGSEIKAILADPRISVEIDPTVLDQVFRYWSPLSPQTMFRGVVELPPGSYLIASSSRIEIQTYWNLEFPETESRRIRPPTSGEAADSLDELKSLLVDSTRIRLRADVPVGAYLSGGLDSSIIAYIIRNHTGVRLDTFSIAFNDPDYDESLFQRRMAEYLGTDHHVLQVGQNEIGKAFPEVIWHTEVPVMRTSPAPMWMLSRMVREHRYKVVLTGEGADEFLGGYDLFKEAAVRRFWARQPQSKWRPLLLRRLYPDIVGLGKASESCLTAFFGEGLSDTGSPFYSHAVRWRNNGRTRRFLSDRVMSASMADRGHGVTGQLPLRFDRWHPMARAQYLETRIFLSQYLLCSQGDRVAMANSVEGRFPFLDYRMVEFANRLPTGMKLRGLTEKYLLKKLGRQWLPPSIWQRPKRPYRAPINRCFFGPEDPGYVRDLLSPSSLRDSDLFNPESVGHLVDRITRGHRIGETDDMAVAGIISTQLLHRQFIAHFAKAPPVGDGERVKVCRSETMERLLP